LNRDRSQRRRRCSKTTLISALATIKYPPGIDDLDPAVAEIGLVAGGDTRNPGAGDRGDLGVALRDGSSDLPAVGDDSGVGARRVAIEWQDALREVVSQHLFQSLVEPALASARR